MRKFLAAVLFGLLLVVGTAPVRAEDGVVTFKFTNNAQHIIYVKMYSQARRVVWPGANSHFVLDDNTEKAGRLSCNVGEQICFGGSYVPNSDAPRYWGVGYTGTKGCQGCCLVCGTEADDVWHAWNLTE